MLLATGVIEDVRRAVTSDLKDIGNPVYLVGRTRPELGGSLWARRTGRADLAVPRPDPQGLRRTGERLHAAIRRGYVRAAHDVSDGGLAVTLAEMAFGGALAFDVDLERVGAVWPGEALAAEGGSRFVVEVPEASRRGFERTIGPSPFARLGRVATGSARLRWGERRLAEIDLAVMYERWRSSLAVP